MKQQFEGKTENTHKYTNCCVALAVGGTCMGVNSSVLTELADPPLQALNAALKTHFSGLAFSPSPLQQFDLVSILLLQSTLRAVFVREKCTTNGIYY